jgi:hypothetical protein
MPVWFCFSFNKREKESRHIPKTCHYVVAQLTLEVRLPPVNPTWVTSPIKQVEERTENERRKPLTSRVFLGENRWTDKRGWSLEEGKLVHVPFMACPHASTDASSVYFSHQQYLLTSFFICFIVVVGEGV